MKIRDILKSKGSKSVFTIPASATLSDLVRGAKEMKVGAFLVTDGKGDLVGIVSERDVMSQCAKSLDFDNIPVRDIMTKEIISADENDGINVAMDLMVARKIRHLPVLSQGRIRGMITIRDLVDAVLGADEQELDEFVRYLRERVRST